MRRIDNPASLDPFAANSANQIRYRIYWDAPRPDISDIFTHPEKYLQGKWVRIQEAGNLTERTVKFHVSAILGKLTASNRTEAVSIAVARGLITR